MKTFTRILSLMMVCMLLLAAAGCGKQKEPAQQGSSSAAPADNGETVNWPTRDVTILTTVKAGGNMDIKARLVAKYLAKELGVNVMVENAPGGGGITGMTQYLAEKPNTHTLIYMGVPHLTTAPFFNEVEYSADDISILCGLDTVENGLFVSTKSGITSFEQLLELGKNGKTIKFGSAGVNNDTFLFTKALFQMAGVQSDSVDAGSSAESLVNCMAGTVDVAYSAMNLAKSYVESGDMLPIGVFSEEGYTGYEGMTVPTFKSMGYDVVYSATSFFAIRSGTDQAVLDKLSGALDNVCANPDFQKEFADAGFFMMEDRSLENIDNAVRELLKDLEGYRSLF